MSSHQLKPRNRRRNRQRYSECVKYKLKFTYTGGCNNRECTSYIGTFLKKKTIVQELHPKMRVTKALVLSVAIIGLLMFIVSIATLFFFIPLFTQIMVEQMLILEPGSTTWDTWISAPIPVYIKFYVWNVTNPHDVQYRGVKPILTEMGPYVYEETMEKENVTFGENGAVISYRQFISYQFRPDMSAGMDSDEATIINAPLVGCGPILAPAGQLGSIVKKFLLNGEPMFYTHSVRDIIWDGIDVKKYVGLVKLAPVVGITIPDMAIPQEIMDGTYSFYEGHNGTGQDSYTVYSGKHGTYMKYSDIIEWNGNVGSVDNWDDKYCNMINGTDVLQFPPLRTKDKPLQVFISDVCRSLNLPYKEEVTYHGIPGFRFEMSASVMQYGDKNPDNWCFCTPQGNCPANGLVNITMCRGGPLLLSNPHFALADPNIAYGVEGMVPDLDKHLSYAEIEPISGQVLRGQKRIQLNVNVQPYSNIPGFEMLPNVILPVFWMEEGGQLDDEYINLITSLVVNPLLLATLICWLVLALGSALFVISFVFWRCKQRQESIEADEMKHGIIKSNNAMENS